MDDLSDQQIQQLLKDAEQRLRAAKGKKGSQDASSFLTQRLPTIASDKTITPYIQKTDQGARVNPSMLINPEVRKLANGIRTVEDPIMAKAKAAKTNLTPELKRDLQLLKMRSVLDPKRFYKKESSKASVPEFSQVGTIIEGPTEFFTARLTNKERKRTLVEEVLQSEKHSGRFKSKYNEIQESKTSGKKAHYKKMKAIRRGEKV
ncbi:putative rRNA-processing protein fcf2 [Glarea lozoyensis 74030]|uniref:Putative rRNA-processing protein fcf2 n=1 Tax=Glarea lozoyensis (strain ATCC 74030 / MF5533) TaxID=1104152 RepID=H0EIF7_GLAL7|nr:putative rRNA-processing protein fcf2 [Glarea lozoyensis 74030]